MARSRNPVPSYLRHPCGKARAVWTDSSGLRRFRMLPGAYDSEESKSAFGRLQLELAATPSAVTAPKTGSTINELMLAYIEHAAKHYVGLDGEPTNEQLLVKIVSRNTRAVYGDLPAAEFGPLALKAVRQKFIDLGWSRNEFAVQSAAVPEEAHLQGQPHRRPRRPLHRSQHQAQPGRAGAVPNSFARSGRQSDVTERYARTAATIAAAAAAKIG